METSHPSTGGLWKRSKGLLAVFCAAGVFFGIASVIKPDPRGAAATPPPPTQTQHPAIVRSITTHPSRGWRLIGTLEGREHVLKCWATPDGPRYSVLDLNGRVIQDELPADEVYRGFPDIDLPNLRLDPADSDSSSSMDGRPRPLLVDFVDTWRE